MTFGQDLYLYSGIPAIQQGCSYASSNTPVHEIVGNEQVEQQKRLVSLFSGCLGNITMLYSTTEAASLAGVAESADAGDLKSLGLFGPCRFESCRRHQ